MLADGQISFDCGLFALGNISRLLCKHRMKPSSVACAAHVGETDAGAAPGCVLRREGRISIEVPLPLPGNASCCGNAPIHEQFQPYGEGGPFQLDAVRTCPP